MSSPYDSEIKPLIAAPKQERVISKYFFHRQSQKRILELFKKYIFLHVISRVKGTKENPAYYIT
jgi:hypothetical protein